MRWAILLPFMFLPLSASGDSLESELEGEWIAHRGTYSYYLDLRPDGTYYRSTLDGRDLGRTEAGTWSARKLADRVFQINTIIVTLRPGGGGTIHLDLLDLEGGALCFPFEPPPSVCYLRRPYNGLQEAVYADDLNVLPTSPR